MDDPVARARERVRKRLEERRAAAAAGTTADSGAAAQTTEELSAATAAKKKEDEAAAELSEGEDALAEARKWLLTHADEATTKKRKKERKRGKGKEPAAEQQPPTAEAAADAAATAASQEAATAEQTTPEEPALRPAAETRTIGTDEEAARSEDERLQRWVRRLVVPPGTSNSTRAQEAAAAADGLYVGRRPMLSDWNAAVWRERLITSHSSSSNPTSMEDAAWNVAEACTTGRQWLYEDGGLPSVTDALKPLHERPDFVEDFSAEARKQRPQSVFMPAAVVLPSVAQAGRAVFQLEVNVYGMTFRDHPLFTEEDFLSTQLGILVRTFRMRQEADLPGFCAERFRLLVGSIRSPALELSPAVREQALRLCEIWREEEQINRHLLKRIASVWKRLTAVRQEQGFSGTEARLSLKLLPGDRKLDALMVERDTLIEFSVRGKQLDQEIARRKAEEQQEQEEGGGEDGDSARHKHHKHKKHQQQQQALPSKAALHDAIRQEIGRTKYSEGFKRYRVRLSAELPTELASLPETELARRERLSKLFYSVQLVINGKRAARTSSKRASIAVLGEDSPAFSVLFSEIFPVQVAKWPDSLALTIFSVEEGKETEIATVPLAVPVIETGSIPRPKPFTSAAVHWRPVWDKSATSQEHTMSGTVLCCAQWSIDEETGSLLYPPIPLKAKQQALSWLTSVDQEEAASSAKLKAWLASADPNDPTRSAQGDCLLGESRAESFAFYDPLRLQGSLEDTRRQKLLRLRRDGRFHGVVPLLEDEITDDMLEEPQPAAEIAAVTGQDVDEAREAELVLLAKGSAADYLELLTHKKRPRMSDVVTTERISFFNLNWLSAITMPKPARPLHPARLDKVPTPLLQLSTPVKVLVQVLHATGLPTRRPSLVASATSKRPVLPSIPPEEPEEKPAEKKQQAEDELDDTQEQPKAEEATPFVQIELSNKPRPQRPTRTRIATGTKPSWNEALTVELSAKPGAGVSLEAMQGEQPFDFVFGKPDAKLHVSLFDDTEEEGRASAAVRSLQIAELSVPLRQLLWYSSRFEGTLRLHEPAYSTSHLHPAGTEQPLEVSLYIALDPPLAPPAQCEEYPTRHLLHLFESDEVSEHVREYCRGLQEMGELRRFSEPYAVTMRRKAVLLSQTIRDLEPPPGLRTWRQFVRFVSLIPRREEPLSFVLRRLRVLATVQEALDMRQAGMLDCAVLLCCVLHADPAVSQVQVILGVAQGDGAVALVMFTSTAAGGKTDQIVVDPATGEWFSLQTQPPHVHLVDVDMIFNKENIWANLQPRLTPLRLLSLELSDSKCWRPFFTRRFPQAPENLAPFQPDIVTYSPTDTKYVKAVQRDVEKHITEVVEQWRRPRLPTHWNRVCSRSLAELLPACEEAAVEFGPGTPLPEGRAGMHNEEFERWRSSFGCTEALAFCVGSACGDGVNEACSRLQRAQLHLTTDRKAEFGLAVHLAPYPSRIAALWIYFAALKS